MNASYNTMTIEDVINTLDPQYRLSPLLKLRGHIAYKATKIAGQYLVSLAKRIFDNKAEHGLQHLDTFNATVEWLRGADIENELLIDAGLIAQKDMFETLSELVQYANKLNYDMQDLVDEGGTKRLRPGFKVRGVAFTEGEVMDSWYNSVQLLADPKDDFDTETYAEYAAKVPHEEWKLTEAEWIAAQEQDDNIWKTYGDDIVMLIMSIGNDECSFDELSPRTQIAAIENMRGKIGRCIEAAMKSVRYNNQLDRAGKIAEATKLKGLINAWDGEFCKMLDSSRYANFTEFMYNYTPQREGAESRNAPVSRRMIARSEQPKSVRVSDAVARHENGETDDKQFAADKRAELQAARAAEEAAKTAERARLNKQREQRKLGLDDLADIINMQGDDVDAEDAHEYNVLGAEEGRYE